MENKRSRIRLRSGDRHNRDEARPCASGVRIFRLRIHTAGNERRHREGPGPSTRGAPRTREPSTHHHRRRHGARPSPVGARGPGRGPRSSRRRRASVGAPLSRKPNNGTGCKGSRVSMPTVVRLIEAGKLPPGWWTPTGASPSVTCSPTGRPRRRSASSPRRDDSGSRGAGSLRPRPRLVAALDADLLVDPLVRLPPDRVRPPRVLERLHETNCFVDPL